MCYKKMGLTDEAIKHFSDAIYLGNNDEIRRLKNDNKQSLYYLSFIYDQFYKRHDFSADAILKVVKQFTNKAKGNERTKRDEQRVSTLEANKSVLNSAKDAKRVLELVYSITQDADLSFEERNERAHQLISAFFNAENPDFLRKKNEKSRFKPRLLHPPIWGYLKKNEKVEIRRPKQKIDRCKILARYTAILASL